MIVKVNQGGFFFSGLTTAITIQDLLGHACIGTTERYCTVSNIKVMRDYFKAMEVIMQRQPQGYP